ncbi:MAG: DEAD/DEAH box helicase [Prosthecobacter sp.]|nr:DEAD/DEAH box helicase [Prosthecobacter sp.]
MSETEFDFPFAKLWGQVRRKAWMWLFDRRLIEAGLVLIRERTQIAAVLVRNPHEVEITGVVGAQRPVLMLRLPNQGDLSVVTQCTCTVGALCKHSAALLMYLDTTEAQSVAERLASRDDRGIQNDEASTDADSAFKAIPLSNDQPRPILSLRRISLTRAQLKMGRSRIHGEISVGVAEPLVEYEGCDQRFPMLVRRPLTSWQDGEGRRFSLARNFGMERLFIADLMQAGLESFADVMPDGAAVEGTLSLMAVPELKQALFWAQFLRDSVPQLRAEGWVVEVADDFGYNVVDAAQETWFTDLVTDTENKDWFSLDLGVSLGSGRVSLVPVLVECIDQGLTPEALEANLDQTFLIAVPGPGNPVLALPASRLVLLLRFLQELLASRPTRKDGKLRLDRLSAAQLQSLDGLPISAPVELAALRQRLEQFTEISAVPLPSGLKAELRPYQRDGLSWLQFLREFGMHGILADDMGLGKTVQTLTHLLLEKEAGRMDRPSLILAPTSVLRNWGREAAKFTPDLRVLLLHGEERRSDFRRIPKHDLVITSYPLLVRDADELCRVDWHVIALDEAQNIKNPKSRAAQVAGMLKARHRLCLTGTPMENHLGELWSLFQFLMPGLLGDADRFRTFYRNPMERERDNERQQQLADRLHPIMLRRTKSAVAKDLPPKTEILHTIELGKAQTDLYETIRAAADKRVREAISAQGLERSQIVVLDALLKLRQVCCHPNLVKAESARQVTESAKTAYLMEELLPELLDEGHKVLIFSQFTEMLAIIEAQLKEQRISHVKLTGETKERETPMRRFQKGEVPVFLISLKAGGAGLNLTAADTVIHYDPWWNPATEAQASDRAHRIGQTKPVFIHKLICQGTIEERIVEMQKSKSALIEGLLTGRTDKLRLTPDDLQQLLTA